MPRSLNPLQRGCGSSAIALYLVLFLSGFSNDASSSEVILFKKLAIKYLEFNKTLGEHERFIEVEPLRVGGRIIYNMVFGYSQTCTIDGRSISVQQTFELNNSKTKKYFCQENSSRNHSEITTKSESKKDIISGSEYRLKVKTSIDSRQGNDKDIITIENIEIRILVDDYNCRVENVAYNKIVDYFPGSRMNIRSDSRSINFWSKCKIEN